MVQVIGNAAHMNNLVADFAQQLLKEKAVNRGRIHAQDNQILMKELRHVSMQFEVDGFSGGWQSTVDPNLPWAEDHFRERISGLPYNPPPSEQWWPFAQNGNSTHKAENQMFSHSYPERFWPRYAGDGSQVAKQKAEIREEPMSGIRFEYGDLGDVVNILNEDSMSRQAYLPVWFPEDLTAAAKGERVPCTLGYHFISQGETEHLDCVYTMRSCDLVRFFRDDVYMAGRLLQWVAGSTHMVPGRLVLHINNLHCFETDEFWLKEQVKKKTTTLNLGAMF
jgi:hypothetical protein